MQHRDYTYKYSTEIRPGNPQGTVEQWMATAAIFSGILRFPPDGLVRPSFS